MKLNKKNYTYIRNFKIFENRVEIRDHNNKPFMVFPALNIPREAWLSWVASCIDILDEGVFSGNGEYEKVIVPMVVTERNFKQDFKDEVANLNETPEAARNGLIAFYADYGFDFSNVNS